jgi:mRNA-degrading endonuclease RelE of RelBE toxin-antitoxin system
MEHANDAIWSVGFSAKAGKQKEKLPAKIDDRLALLVRELIAEGPAQPEWKHYGRLTGKKGEYHHCHLNAGRPTYVVVWQVLDRQVRIMDVRYVGTHESVNYNSFA